MNFGGMPGMMGGALNNVGNMGGNAVNGVGNMMGGTMNTMGGAMGRMGNTMGGMGNTMGNTMGGAMGQMGNTMGGMMGQIPGMGGFMGGGAPGMTAAGTIGGPGAPPAIGAPAGSVATGQGIPPTVAAQYGKAATQRRNTLAQSQLYPTGSTDPTSVNMTYGMGSVAWQQHPIYKNDFNMPRRTVTRVANPDVPVNPYESIHTQERQGVQNFLSNRTNLDMYRQAAVAASIAPEPGRRFSML